MGETGLTAHFGTLERHRKDREAVETVQREFYIGEMADLLGVSKDTLRIYEEQDLLQPRRDENGFRRYQENDACRLIGIKFYRENLIPMKDVRELFCGRTQQTKLTIIEARIREEEELLLRHRKNIVRLKLARSYYGSLRKEGFTVDRMPAGFVVSEPRKDFFETMQDYFTLGKEDPDMTLCYLNAEYDLQKSLERPQRTYLFLKQQEMDMLKRETCLQHKGQLTVGQCVKGTITSEFPVPEKEKIEALLCYADKEGIRLSGKLYAHFVYQYEEEARPGYLIEMYAPFSE